MGPLPLSVRCWPWSQGQSGTDLFPQREALQGGRSWACVWQTGSGSAAAVQEGFPRPVVPRRLSGFPRVTDTVRQLLVTSHGTADATCQRAGGRAAACRHRTGTGRTPPAGALQVRGSHRCCTGRDPRSPGSAQSPGGALPEAALGPGREGLPSHPADVAPRGRVAASLSHQGPQGPRTDFRLDNP